MSVTQLFTPFDLENRLGQPVQLGVYVSQWQGQEFVFVTALDQKASSLVAKNAEHFAFQLLEKFQIDVRRGKLIELRGDGRAPQFWRWRFEWVGNSPLAPRSEFIKTPSQQYKQLLKLLNIGGGLQSASA